MTRGQALAAAVIILVLAWVHGALTGILATIAIIVTCLVTGRIHPRVRHVGFRGCGGTGEHRGFFFPWRFRKCPRCNSGRLIGWTAGHYGAGHIQGEYQRSRRARTAARGQNRWR